jgi:hypothetical protein
MSSKVLINSLFKSLSMALVTSVGIFFYSLSALAESYAPVVTERIPGATGTPAWTSGARVMWQEKDNVVFAYSLEMSGDSRPSACMRAASLQVEDVSSDPEFEAVTASLAQGSITGASVKEQYWEKVLKTDVRGEKVLRIVCASKVQVSRADLDAQFGRVIEVETARNPEMRHALMMAQTDFLNSLD